MISMALLIGRIRQ